jgi:hypothetical protein
VRLATVCKLSIVLAAVSAPSAHGQNPSAPQPVSPADGAILPSGPAPDFDVSAQPAGLTVLVDVARTRLVFPGGRLSQPVASGEAELGSNGLYRWTPKPQDWYDDLNPRSTWSPGTYYWQPSGIGGCGVTLECSGHIRSFTLVAPFAVEITGRLTQAISRAGSWSVFVRCSRTCATTLEARATAGGHPRSTLKRTVQLNGVRGAIVRFRPPGADLRAIRRYGALRYIVRADAVDPHGETARATRRTAVRPFRKPRPLRPPTLRERAEREVEREAEDRFGPGFGVLDVACRRLTGNRYTCSYTAFENSGRDGTCEGRATVIRRRYGLEVILSTCS